MHFNSLSCLSISFLIACLFIAPKIPRSFFKLKEKSRTTHVDNTPLVLTLIGSFLKFIPFPLPINLFHYHYLQIDVLILKLRFQFFIHRVPFLAMCNGQNINTSLVGEVGHITNINFHICTIINVNQPFFFCETFKKYLKKRK